MAIERKTKWGRLNVGLMGLAIAFGALGLAADVFAPAPAAAAFRAPDSVADLTEGLLESVVFIQVSQSPKADRQTPAPNLGPTPKAPDGSPFQEFFDDYFNKQKNRDQAPRVQSVGSGFIIDEAGIIITNNHVIDGADDIEITFSDGSKLKGELVGRDTKVDVAVLKVKATKPLKPVKFGDSDKARVGDWVLAIGNPFGLGETVTLGIISAKNRDIHSGPYDNYLQTDAAINKGNSGGPLFNMNGEVVGINTAIISPSGTSAGIGFAVPSNTAMPVIEQLKQYGETRRGWLGVNIQEVTGDIADSVGLKVPKGALIAHVVEKGPSDQAGITAGDIIVKFDGHDVPTARDLQRMVADTSIAKEVDVVVLRKGNEVTVKVKLGRLEEGEKIAEKEAAGDTKPAAKVLTQALGLGLATLDADARQKFKIGDKVVKGVLVADVGTGTPAADKRIVPGDVIVEVGQEAVETPADVIKRIDALKQEGRKRILMMVSNGNGEIRFVPLSVE
ncbi:MAG: DegQ family serine endoprotease [Ancalomicrobiaceae bacterium]|nr:DegQ family serine endoprotease [Ancalomicrobiaceae bacterium]